MSRVAASASEVASRLIEGRATSAKRLCGIECDNIADESSVRHAIGGCTSRVDEVENEGSTAPATLPVANSGALGENATVAERWTCFKAGILARPAFSGSLPRRHTNN